MAERDLNAVKPRRGLVVKVAGHPGLWQLSDRSPHVGMWWLVAYDNEARDYANRPGRPKGHAGFTEARARDMKYPERGRL